MVTRELEILLTLRDQASSALKGFQKNLKDMEPAFKTMATVGTVAFGAISAEIYTAVSAAAEAEKAHAQLEAVLKSTGHAAGLFAEDITDQAAALQKLTTFSDEAILSAQSLLLTFTQVKGPIFQESIGVILDMSTALGQDLKSSAIQVGKALQDPINGITALRRVGVNFSEAQQEVIAKLVESGKVVEAQRMILKELNTEFGGSASAAANTFAGRIEQVRNQVDELQESIGRALMPALSNVVQAVTPIVLKLQEWAEANPELIARLLAVGLAVSGLVAAFGFLGLAAIAVTAGLAALASPIGLLAVSLAVLAGAAVYLQGRFGEILAQIDEKTGLVTAFRDAWQAIADTWTNVYQPALAQLWASLQPLAPFLTALADIIGRILGFALSQTVQHIVQWIAATAQLLVILTQASSWLATQLTPAIKAVGETVAFVVQKVEALINAFSRLSGMNVGGLSGVGSAALGAVKSFGLPFMPFAEGGIVTRPTLGLVGEAGPEAIIPLSKARGLGSVVINVYGDVTGMELVERVKEAIMDGMRADSRFAI